MTASMTASMTIAELSRELAAGCVQQLYAIIGGSIPLRRQALETLRKHVCPADLADWNIQEVDGAGATGSAIATMAATAPFIGERRLIIVHGYDNMALAEQEALIAALPVAVSVVALVADSVDKRTKAGQALAAKAVVVAVDEPKADALAPWLLAYGRRQGVTIERPAAEAMISISGGNTGFLAQEVAKFAAYLGGEGVVTPDLVHALAARGEAEPEQYAIFRLTEALVDQNPAVALAQLDDLINAGEPALRILAMIARQYRMLIAAKAWQADGAAAAARALNMKPFAVEKLFGRAQRWSLADIEAGMRRILAADLALKSGGEPVGTLQMLLIDLATKK